MNEAMIDALYYRALDAARRNLEKALRESDRVRANRLDALCRLVEKSAPTEDSGDG